MSVEATYTRTKRGLVPEDLGRFRWLKEVAMSPGGAYIAYTVSAPDLAANGYQVHLYIYDVQTSSVRKLTTEGQVSAPVWSRDGSQLAYAWQRDGSAQVVVWSADDADAVFYPVAGAAPGDLDWSPDGKRLAFSRWTQIEADFTAPRPGIPAPTIKVVRRLRYKQDGAGWVHDRYRHLFTLDLETGDIAQITGGECDYSQPRWSWGGDRLACVATAREQNTPMGQGQIMILDMATGALKPVLPQWMGAAISPQWRADDGAIAFAGYNAPPPVNRRLFHHAWIADLSTGEATDLTASIDQTVGNYAVSDQRPGLTNVTVKWPGGEGPLYFLLTVQGATHLYRTSTDNPQPEELVGGPRVTFDYAPATDGSVAYGMAHTLNPGELFLLRDGESTQITNLNPWLNGFELSEPQEYWYEGLDGARVHAWEMKPVNFTPGRKYPVIVYVHCSMFSWDFYHEFQCLTNAGFGVVYFNARGTTAGYGQECALGNYYGKQEDEFAEIMRGVDDLGEWSWVDPNRLGVTGGSCGGFMTNWIVGHTDRFAAAVTQRSVVDLVSKYGTSDNGPEQSDSEGGGPPWENIERLWYSSPIAYAPHVTTPLLIIHSAEDHRCTVSQAEELFAALRWHGKETELVIFEGESHGLSRGGRPGNRVERLRRISGWFEKYLR